MSKADLRLDFVNYKAASYAVKQWHYAPRMPQGTLVKIGVWERDRFIGVLLFGRGATNALGSLIGLDHGEVCELVRVALREHEAPVSRIVAIALRLLRQTSPGIRAVISFADPAEGHHGGIYQALGWTYTGRSKPEPQFFYQGRWVHSRAVKTMGAWAKGDGKESPLRRLYKAGKLPTRRTPGKLRYILPLDATIADRVRALAKPYPKRHDIQASESSTRHPPGSGRGSTDPDAPSCQLPSELRQTDIESTVAAVRSALTDELRRPKYRGKADPMAGHCYVASEALYHLLGGKAGPWRPVRLRHEDDSHWFLRRADGAVLDITASQFKTPVSVQNAKGAGFLTREPSKRAVVVIKRAQAVLSRRVYEAQDERRLKKQARNAVRSALRNGTMKRQRCKHVGSDCSGLVTAHHVNGYDRAHWLDVEWLCRRHHELEHAADKS